ncbi:hypothetical protein IM792_17890 [Mucilaginibacter sp. JRF]|uniref:hypothetical protein n=1 Tax=Mucilaginibacter sp. JRF TaxID=2780088 RepID=UPI00188056D4|nr:hypothetical protein [Mucilaginibacter sp. JRF]MBE9586329.1 hypothetical protein [Mucilaginibacter sp. JRF]
MKRTFYLFALIGLAVISCKKEKKSTPAPDNEAKTYAVNFNVGIDISSVNTLSTVTQKTRNNASVDLSSVAKFLAYYIYNSENTLVAQVVQDSTTTRFGTISQELSNGTYTIIVFATKTAPDQFDQTKVKAIGKEIFYAKYPFTVSSTDVTKNLDLKRVNGQLQVVITDAIPQSVASISYQINNDREFMLSTGLPNVQSPYQHYHKKDVTNYYGTNNYTFKTFVTNTISPVSVIITVYNDASTPVKTVTIDSVVIQPNTRTILSGNLFSDAQHSFGITYGDYSDTTIVDF